MDQSSRLSVSIKAVMVISMDEPLWGLNLQPLYLNTTPKHMLLVVIITNLWSRFTDNSKQGEFR